MGVSGRTQSGDRFSVEETIEGVLAGSGPIAITARVREVNAGEWNVAAEMVEARAGERSEAGADQSMPIAAQPLFPAAWSWRRWRVTPAPRRPVRTCLAPLARPPARSAPGKLDRARYARRPGRPCPAGAAVFRHGDGCRASHDSVADHDSRRHRGAKAWYLVLNRHKPRRDVWWLQRWLVGWCIQGFIAGAAVAAPPLLAATHTPVGSFLDLTAPGLLTGLAIGRLGCFFIGCCVGRPTASRWGVWSSDQRLGMRRIPTQLMESASALAIGLVLLVVVVRVGRSRAHCWSAGWRSIPSCGRRSCACAPNVAGPSSAARSPPRPRGSS